MANDNKNQNKNGKKTTIAGQALIEGILMRGPERTAIAFVASELVTSGITCIGPITSHMPKAFTILAAAVVAYARSARTP